MTNNNIEIEIKALVEDAAALQAKIESKYDMSICTITDSSQLNHYFNFSQSALELILSSHEGDVGWDVYHQLSPYKEELLSSPKIAVRTRYDSEQGVLLIFKYSLVDSNSENGTIRKELEFPIATNLSELDYYLTQSGFTYQSKWSRSRKQYAFISGWTLCLDTNAGYGSLLEVEYMATEEEYAKNKDFLLYKAKTFLDTLGLVELSEDLLKLMFDFYSANYDTFYGTSRLIWNDNRFPYGRDGSSRLFPGMTALLSNLKLDGAIV